MAKNELAQVMTNGNEINFIEKDGEFWLSAEQIGANLGYENPAHDINRLFRKNYHELSVFSVGTKLVSTDGKAYNTRIFSEQGIYLISMLARTQKAREFRGKVAKLLADIRKNQMAQAYQDGIAHASSLPAIQSKEAAARLAGIEEGIKIQKKNDGLVIIKKALGYLRRGFTFAEVAKQLDISRETLRKYLKQAEIYDKAKAIASRFISSKDSNVLDIKEVYTLYSQGVTRKQLAEKFEVSEHRIRHAIDKARRLQPNYQQGVMQCK